MSTLPRPAQHMVLGMGSLTMGGVSKFFVNMNVTRVKQWTGQAASAPTMAQ